MGRFVDALAAPGPRRDRRDQAALSLGGRPPARTPTRRHRARLRRGGAAAISVLVDERFGGSWDDLRAARAPTVAPLLAKGFFSTADDLQTAKEAGADARSCSCCATSRRAGCGALGGGASSASTRSSRRTTRRSSTAAIASAPAARGQRARPPTLRDRPRHAARLVSAPRRPRDRRDRHQHRAQGAAAELAGADAVLVGSALMRAPDPAESSRSSCPPAREGLRVDARGGRRGRVEAGADLARLRPRAGEPARGRATCSGPGDDARRSRLRRRGERLTARPRPGATTRRGGRGARPRGALCGAARRSHACSTCPWDGGDPDALGRAAAARGPGRARGGARARERRRGDRRGAALGGRRARRSSVEPGIKDHARVRAYVEAART